ncbi:MAG: glycosyltransferase family 39 protein [Planctomycetaceae bacterium]|jgi:hypothetical protein|nr:glycosyltransferase family 39 protein [Planctomycetaceae bacterium]
MKRLVFGFFVFCFLLCLFLFASSRLPLTWDEGEVSRRSDELPAKWSGTIDNEGHPQLPIILAATGKNLLPQKLFSKKFRLRFASIFFVSISFTVLFYRLRREFDGVVACFAIMSVLLIPRLFALLQIATWDSCLIASWICCLATFPLSLRNIRNTALFGFCLGLAFSSKFSALAIPIPFALWAIIVLLPDKSLRKIVLVKHLFIVTIISATVFFLLNPPLWSNPVSGIIRFFNLNFHREINIPIMFLGQLYDLQHQLPFYNTIFWTIITVPTGLLFFFLVGCCSILYSSRFKIRKAEYGKRSITERLFKGEAYRLTGYGISWRFGLLLFLNMVVLLLIRMLSGVPVHDGVRLFAGSYVFLGIFAGIGATAIWRTKNLLPRIITIIIFAISLFNMFWYAPQWLSYYNFAVGGLSGAVKIGMEPTYYWDGFDDEVIKWLNANTGKDELILFSKFSPDTFSIYREDGVLLPEFYAEAVLKSEKLNTQAQQRGAIVQGRSLPPIPAPVYVLCETDSDKKISAKNKTKRIRYYVMQNRTGLQTTVDVYFKSRAQPVYTKTIRKGGFGAWNLGTTPIIEIYDVKKLPPISER